MSQSLGMMSYNLRYATESDGENQWENRKEKVVDLLAFYDPAVFGIQEGLLHQLQYIDQKLPNYTYTGVGRDDGKEAGEFSAIFYDSTSLKLTESGTFWLSETPEKVSVGWDASMERICTYGLFEVRASGKQFWVFNAHFDHRGPMARLESAKLILEKVAQYNTHQLPVVLMGDLNVEPDSNPIKAIVGKMEDGLHITEKPFYGPVGTFNGFEKSPVLDRRIDYIFTSNLEVVSYAHIDDRYGDNRFVSDHLPVWMKAKL